MKKNNGFTLIELIAVITILSLIVLISVPVIINTLNKAKQRENDESVQIIKNAAELFLERNKDLYPNFNETGDGINIAIDVLIDEGYLKDNLINSIDNKNIRDYKVFAIYGQDEIIEYKIVDKMSFAGVTTISNEVTTINTCVISGPCQPGTKFAIEVNDDEVYNFYVIADNGNDVDLIMDKNLLQYAKWNASDINAGPIDALNSLETATFNWKNITEKEYVIADTGGGRKYTEIEKTMRARLLTYAEATSPQIGCTINSENNSEKCPGWLYDNLEKGTHALYGYWTSDAVTWDGQIAIGIFDNGFLDYATINADGTATGNAAGIRPVITLSRI